MGTLDFSVLFRHSDRFMEGFLNTIQVSVMALIGSFVLGAILAIFRISPVKPLNWFGTAFVEFIRNIPLLLVVFFSISDCLRWVFLWMDLSRAHWD